MLGLTERQIQILKLIVEEFISTGMAVGSETLDRKYNLGVSPATIRNEMVFLTKQNYLNKAHSSAGRLPTYQALKLYVHELMKEKDLSVADEVDLKEKIWRCRNQFDQLMLESTKILAEKSKVLSLILIDDQKLYHSGYANLLDMREFNDLRLMKQVLSLIEEVEALNDIFSLVQNEDVVKVVYGKELGNQILEPVSVVYTVVNSRNHLVKIALFGSKRFDYPYIFPMMKYFNNLISEVLN
jgi:heat-inducible transcriptional repressor